MDAWNNNRLQFARLISELESVGTFTNDTIQSLCEEMDLTSTEVCEIISRAQQEFDKAKLEL